MLLNVARYLRLTAAAAAAAAPRIAVRRVVCIRIQVFPRGQIQHRGARGLSGPIPCTAMHTAIRGDNVTTGLVFTAKRTFWGQNEDFIKLKEKARNVLHIV